MDLGELGPHSMNLLATILSLPKSRRIVQHEPETPRYWRARRKLVYILKKSVILGDKSSTGSSSGLEVATWAPAGSGHGFGFYCCFRVYFEGENPTMAILYCFYDGSEGSPGFGTLESAQAYAFSRDFKELSDGT